MVDFAWVSVDDCDVGKTKESVAAMGNPTSTSPKRWREGLAFAGISHCCRVALTPKGLAFAGIGHRCRLALTAKGLAFAGIGHRCRAALTPKGSRVVATGEAKRNPWEQVQ